MFTHCQTQFAMSSDLDMLSAPPTSAGSGSNGTSRSATDVADLSDKRDIGNLAHWSLSSFKPGFGIPQLRSENREQYWQSDGPQPHFINIHFPKRVAVNYLSIYTDYKQDESYTPNKIGIKAGTGFHDLQEVIVIDMNEPTGWTHVPLGDFGNKGMLRLHLIQVCILGNHQNGKDTHVRNVKVFSPRHDESAAVTVGPGLAVKILPFMDPSFEYTVR
ncbi:hypothetical protein YB2330_000401 [Saitoella coloradoensis]